MGLAMIIGGHAGKPDKQTLVYSLGVRRVEHRTGEPIDSGLMLVSPFRGLLDNKQATMINQGVADGGEGSLPPLNAPEYEGTQGE